MAEQSSRTLEGVSAGEFVHILLECGLVSSEEMAAVRGALAGTDPAAGDAELVRRLVESDRLTNYQIRLVRERRLSELVIGSYEVLDKLGAGGMGAVFKARHRRMKRIVALKVLAKELADDDTFVLRFQREVETIAQLSHPNIVMAFDAGVSDVGHFLVMEFVDGRDFDSLVTRGGPLTLSAAVDCIVQAGRGLEYAHGRGMIHRDIKPANLLREARGLVKITDLGLARFRHTGSSGGGLTQAGGILGTVDYMPPEQAMDATQTDHRADIYSLGATLHFLMTGRAVYPERSLTAALLKHRDAPIPSLRDARKDVPVELDAIFRRMMAKAPADRQQTMTEVVRALEAVQASLGDPSPGDPSLIHLAGTLMLPGKMPHKDVETSLAGQAQTVAEAKPNEAKPNEAKPNVPRGPLRVVLVEPSRAQSGIIRRYLLAQGIEQVVVVASGQEALAAIRKERPDALVSALHLADMTGVQLAQHVRAESDKAGQAAPGFVLISSEADSAESGSLSKYGKGTILKKPFTPEKLSEALRLVGDPTATPAAGPTPNPGKLRVLIVDDSAPARLHMRNVLKGLGLEQFVEAPDGAQAVAAVAQGAFDLIVTDYNMPFMDGRGLVGYLRQNPATAAAPIIMVTTETDPAKLDAVRQLGVTVCDKSFPAEVVRGVLDKIASVK